MNRRSFLLFLCAAAGCGPMDAASPQRPPIAQKWLERAEQSYKVGDFEDAKTSVDETLRMLPHDDEARVVAARLALARLDFDGVLKLTAGLKTSETHSLRGRAQWYLGSLGDAADELDAYLADPSVKDSWARDVSRLARKGASRKPFAIDGGVVAMVDMPPAGSALVVPCEIEGEQVLTMVGTGNPEVVVDSGWRSEPDWVTFKFADRVEVHDVPVLTQDLSALSRVLGAPIRALLGVNFLRHAHATFDRRGSQFIVRLNEPPSPPEASRMPLYYAHGGGMMLRMQVAPHDDGTSVFYVDSAQPWSLVMQDALWKKAGVDLQQLVPSTVLPNSRAGRVPSIRLAGMSFPMVPGLALGSVNDQAPPLLDVDLGGIVGAGLLEAFRITFTDDGRFVWVEPDPTMKDDVQTR